MHGFESKLLASWPRELWSDITIVVAVSGGADSVALLHALSRIRGEGRGAVVVAHLNHQLRGQLSDEDAAWVEQLANRLGLRCHVGLPKQPIYGRTGGEGLEAAARDARYEFLVETAKAIGARHVVTAHTANDQAETILFRIVRGTGVGGLAGIPRVRPLFDGCSLIRPMLSFWRAEIVEYLDSLGVSYREDHTNDDPRFARNRIRRELIPLLESQFNSHVQESIFRLGTIANQVNSLCDSLVDAEWDAIVQQQKPDRVVLDRERLAPLHDYLVREFLVRVWREQGWPLQQMNQEKWDQLIQLIRASQVDSPAAMVPGGIRVFVSPTEFVLASS